MMTPAEPVDAGLPYRPESAEHFKELAKNVAWLFALPLQETQECLSRIYGYENLHELQANLEKPGEPGPYPWDWRRKEARTDRCREMLLDSLAGHYPDANRFLDRIEMLNDMGVFEPREVSQDFFRVLKKRLGKDKGGSQAWPTPALKEWLDGLFAINGTFDLEPLKALKLYAGDAFSSQPADPESMLQSLRSYLEPMVFLRTAPVMRDPHPDLPSDWRDILSFLDGYPSAYLGSDFETFAKNLFEEELHETVLPKYLGEGIENFYVEAGKDFGNDTNGWDARMLSVIPDGQKLVDQWKAALHFELAKDLQQRQIPKEVIAHWISTRDTPLSQWGDTLAVFIHLEADQVSGIESEEMEDMSIWGYCTSFWLYQANSGEYTPVGVMRGRYIVPHKGRFHVSSNNFQYVLDAHSAMLNDVWKVLQFEYFPRLGFNSVEEFCKCEDSDDNGTGIVVANIELLPEFRGHRITPHLINLFTSAIEEHPGTAWTTDWQHPFIDDDFDYGMDDNLIESSGRHAQKLGYEIPKPGVFVFPVEGTPRKNETLSIANLLLTTSPQKVSGQKKDPEIEARRKSLTNYFTSLDEETDADIVVYNPWDYPTT